MGEWSGLTFEELDRRPEWRQFNTVRSMTRVPGGETMLELQARMVNELESVRKRHPDRQVAVVSHADPIRAAVCYFAGIPLDFSNRIAIDPASVSVVELDGDAPRLVRLNHTGDLP